MILGTGIDLCDIRRIERVLERHGERFLLRVFTDTERARAARQEGRVALGTLAKRFAAKEAASKALGTGFSRGVFLSSIGVVNAPGGRPTLVMTGGAAARLVQMTPPGLVAHAHLSMTDEYPLAQAQVVIEAVPA